MLVGDPDVRRQHHARHLVRRRRRIRRAVHRLSLRKVQCCPLIGPRRIQARCSWKEFLEPLGVSQVEAATRMNIPFQRLNAIVKARRAVSADTALLLGALTGWDAQYLAYAAGQVGPVARHEGPRAQAEGYGPSARPRRSAPYAPSTVAATPHVFRHRGARQRRVFRPARRDSRCIEPSPKHRLRPGR